MSVTITNKSRLVPIYAPLRLIPSRSQLLGVGLTITVALSIMTIMILAMPGLTRLVITCTTLLGGWLELRLHVLRDVPWAITEAVWDANGKWSVRLSSGKVCEAKLSRDSFVTIPLVILNFRLQHPCQYTAWYFLTRRSLVLTADSCDTETLRRLRVRLRLEYYKSTLTTDSIPS